MEFIDHQVVEVKEEFCRAVDELVDQARQGERVRVLEQKLWLNMLRVVRAVMALLLSVACWVAASRKLRAAGIAPDEAQWRRERACHGTLMTTAGPVVFCWHMVRVRVGGHEKTLNFAQPDVLPAWRSCRSSSLLMEWESSLAAEHPFRSAAKALEFFTHGAVDIEDTTIAVHAETIGRQIERQWLYKTPEEIRRILVERATTDKSNSKPVVYFSCDATSLRRYVDAGWLPRWKNANGLRIWCVDRQTGELIHIGGEHTWGDCHEVERIFGDLNGLGILPFDGDYGGAVRAQLVFLSDGATWFDDHIMPLFDPEALTVILDAWHVAERIGTFAAQFPASAQRDAKRLLDAVLPHVTGTPEPSAAPKSRTRKGHKKRPPGDRCPRPRPSYPSVPGADDAAEGLLITLRENTPKRQRGTIAYNDLFNFLNTNAHRIGYAEFSERGLLIGSGPMESLHRVPQLRIKRPGAKWTPEGAIAICNLRMLQRSGRWDEFFDQPLFQHTVAEAFATPAQIPIAA